MQRPILRSGLWLVALLTVSALASAQEPADDIIRTALADLERYEAQAAGLPPGNSAGANRILKLMGLSQERLDQSAHQDDPSWQAVNQRYLDLRTRLESGAPTTVQSTAPPSTPPSATPAPAAPSAPAGAPELVSGQRVQVRKLTRDMTQARTGLVTTGPSSLQDPDQLASRQKQMSQFAAALERYPQVHDPDVQAARDEYEALRQALSAEFQRSREQLAQLGDVQKALAAIEGNATTYPVPAPLEPPFTDEQARAWVEAAGKARTVAEHATGQLSTIAELAWLPQNPGTPQTGAPYDEGDVDRLQRNAAAASVAVQENYRVMAQRLDERMGQMSQELSSRWSEDPEAEETRWLFIADGQAEEAQGLFDAARAVAQSSIALESALGREVATAQSLVDQADAAQQSFERKRELAMASSRLPEPRSDDATMLAVAREILANPRYEFGQHGRIVLTTAGVVERERKDSEIEFDKANVTLAGDIELSGTETTWTYRWEEFKFAVPLKETDSDRWYIWWIAARKYSSGGPNTPLGQWVSGEATKGNPIPADRT